MRLKKGEGRRNTCSFRHGRSSHAASCGLGLRETAALGEAIFSHAQEALVRIDAAHRIRALNPAAEALLGIPEHSARGRLWREVFQLERELAYDYRENPIARCLSRPQVLRLPANTLLVCGSRLRQPVSGVAQTLSRHGRREVLLLLQAQLFAAPPAHDDDTSSRFREHEALLAHMFRLNTVGELATGIAHELNQPLSAILSYSQAALRLMHDEEPNLLLAGEAMLEAAAQARRAGDILRQLRAFVSKQHSGYAAVAINQVIINTLTLLAGPLQEAGVQVALQTEPCPPVLADGIQIEQVLVNLVRNAIEAMQVTPRECRLMRLRSYRQHHNVVVEVSDSGPGFTADAHTRLFTRFFSTKKEGMGLGLNISQTIIEAAGGAMEAENHAQGGALFRFSLPVLHAEEPVHVPA